MKTNLIKRTLSLAIVICMVIAMVAVAPMASAAGNPSLTFGVDVYEYTNGATEYVRASVYIIGYYNWENPIHNLQLQINFDNTKLTYVSSVKGTGAYAGLGTLPGQSITASTGSTGVSAANERGYVVFLFDGPNSYFNEDSEEDVPMSVPEATSADAKLYLRTYNFTVKEDATGDCDFAVDATQVFATNTDDGTLKIINGALRTGDVSEPATYTIPGGVVETFVISYNANGGAGTMANTEGENPAVAANAFTRAGYSFAGWNTAADGNGTAYAVGATPAANVALYAIWTKNDNAEVASWYKMIGAQAREATGTKSAGLRFGVNLADLMPGVAVQEAGMIVIPTDVLEGELTHDTPNCATGEFTGYLNDPTDNSLIYTAVLVNIPAGQEARPITARGFVKVNGNYYYTDPIVRNYADVLAALHAMQ